MCSSDLWTTAIGAITALGLTLCTYFVLREPEVSPATVDNNAGLTAPRPPAGAYVGMGVMTAVTVGLLLWTDLTQVALSLFALVLVLGAIVGGTAGNIIAQGSNFGLSTYFLKFSREYESQADVNGSHILADAGYDPRDMANMFKTIEEQGGGGTPQWLSSHPNPGNRYQRINQEATLLKVAPGSRSDNKAEFDRVQARLKQLPPALTAEQIGQLVPLASEIVLLGTGDRLRFPRPEILRPLMEARIGFEVMDVRAACRTYNILVAEERKVAAALLLGSA